MSDDDDLVEKATDALVGAVGDAIDDWVRRCVTDVLHGEGRAIDEAVEAMIAAAGAEASRTVMAELRAALSPDIDQQRTNPLAILRAAVRFPTAVLLAAHAIPVARDEFDTRAFPGDLFALTPTAFADFGPAVHDAGLVWGAAKAHTHLRRHTGA